MANFNWNVALNSIYKVFFVVTGWALVTGRSQLVISEIEKLFSNFVMIFNDYWVKTMDSVLCMIFFTGGSVKRLDVCHQYISENLSIHLEWDISLTFIFGLTFILIVRNFINSWKTTNPETQKDTN